MVYLFNSNDVELVESYGKFKLCSMPDDEVARFKHDVAKKEEVDMEMMDKFNLFAVVGKTQKDIPMSFVFQKTRKTNAFPN